VNPLSSIYAAGVKLKNRLYDAGMLKANRLLGPVVSVGNLSIGGTGKTPFVILLGELLKQRGIRFDVLSRGYGRESRGAMIVDPNGSARQFGDEPLLITRRLGCPVVVGEKRYEAGLLAEKSFGPQLHLLDDGFQHRELARDFDIVLFSPEDLSDKPLPVGCLREPVASLKRANVIVVPEGMDFTPPVGKFLWRIRRDIEIPNASDRPLAFCGIARPQRFIDQLEKKGVSPVATRFFRDHHAYSRGDVEELLRLCDETTATGFITTEKDAINLDENMKVLGAVAVARVCMELVNPADALDIILRLIGERKPSA